MNELSAPTKQLLITDSLSKPKNLKEYNEREEIHEFEQRPIQHALQTTKIEVLPLIIKGTAKEQMDLRAAKRKAERRISLEKTIKREDR